MLSNIYSFQRKLLLYSLHYWESDNKLSLIRIWDAVFYRDQWENTWYPYIFVYKVRCDIWYVSLCKTKWAAASGPSHCFCLPQVYLARDRFKIYFQNHFSTFTFFKIAFSKTILRLIGIYIFLPLFIGKTSRISKWNIPENEIDVRISK